MNTTTLEKLKNNDAVINDLFNQIEDIILKNKTKMVYQINDTLVNTYFYIGKTIIENEQNGNIRAEYGKDVLKKLSKKLTDKFGTGFSRFALQNMRLFYNKYKNCQPVTGKLSWSHYCYLIYIEDDKERNFYEKDDLNNNALNHLIFLCIFKQT